MNDRVFDILCFAVAATFTVAFLWMVGPAIAQDGDIPGAFAAGFVNPYSSGYSTDVILCWVTLAFWVLYEARAHSLRHGWVCVLLGVVPGVAVGLPLYLVLRRRQLGSRAN